jgi:hypothetical protein
MSKIISTLDCGCAIYEDGRRAWCPTCSAHIESGAERRKGAGRRSIDEVELIDFTARLRLHLTPDAIEIVCAKCNARIFFYQLDRVSSHCVFIVDKSFPIDHDCE